MPRPKSRYSIGSPEPERPTAIAGDWKSEPIVLSLLGRVKLVVRVPEEHRAGGPGAYAAAELFERQLRDAVAAAMIGIQAEGFRVVGAVVEQFEDAQG